MDAVLDQIPDGGRYYLTVDADGLDPTIMPAVNAPTPGGCSANLSALRCVQVTTTD